MDGTSLSSGLGDKLIVLLQKLKHSDLKCVDDVFFEKLLTCIKNELSASTGRVENLNELVELFNSIAELWVDDPPPASILSFVLQLIGIFCGDEDIFNYVQKSNLLNTHLNCLKVHIYRNTNLKLTYITFLSSVISHKSGCLWITVRKCWREVVEMYLSKSSLFIERQALKFLCKLLLSMDWDNDLLEEVFSEILRPLESFRRDIEMGKINKENEASFYAKIEPVAVPVLHAFTVILETYLVSSNVKNIKSTLQNIGINNFLKLLLENCYNGKLLEKVSGAYILHLLAALRDTVNISEIQEMPDFVLDVFKMFVKQRKISNIIKLANYCQLIWNKINLNASVENHFIIIQLIPAFILIRNPKQENCFLEIYKDKLYDLTTDETLRLAYSIRDAIKCEPEETFMDYGYQAVLSISDNMETLNLKRAVMVFQAFAYILHIFIPRSCDYDHPISDEQFERQQMLVSTNANFLSSVLNSICVLIGKFKINWTEAVESLCLVRFSAMLLNNPNLSPRLSVQTLSLVKLAIMNYMAPDLVLLVNKIEGTGLESLFSVLYNRLHDPNWEIRDSCVEVIGVIAELAETKYPVFQDILIGRNFCDLMVNMMERDAESYVRSSAVKVLSQMIRVESLRNNILNGNDVMLKIIILLMNDSEGIVRREAALLAKELFANQSSRSDEFERLFHVMGYAAIYDLHWEVKVNALYFWERVIQMLVADQGMIDGFFPSITFSKDNKKIVSLTGEEIKSRLNKVLNKLSNVGCLHVLITTLKDDCDFPVVQKSAQILTDLLDLLRRYDVFEAKCGEANQNDKQRMKRKSSYDGVPEKKSSQCLKDESETEDISGIKSSRVIEDIVNEMDLSLLGKVLNPNKEIPLTSTTNFYMKKIKPDLFLLEMQHFNILSFVNSKQKWLLSKEDDLNELLNDVLTLSIEYETNVLDCY